MNWLQKLIAKFRRKPVKPEIKLPKPAVPRLTPVSSVASDVQYKQAVRSHLNVSARPKPNYVPPQPAPIRNVNREYRTETRVESSSDVDLTPLVVAYMMQPQTSPSYSCPAPEPEKFSSGGGGDYGGGGASGSWDSGSSSSDSGSSDNNY